MRRRDLAGCGLAHQRRQHAALGKRQPVAGRQHLQSQVRAELALSEHDQHIFPLRTRWTERQDRHHQASLHAIETYETAPAALGSQADRGVEVAAGACGLPQDVSCATEQAGGRQFMLSSLIGKVDAALAVAKDEAAFDFIEEGQCPLTPWLRDARR